MKLALDAVHGVDINPFAVAIARFRLLIAAMSTCGFSTLLEAAALHLSSPDRHRRLPDQGAATEELVRRRQELVEFRLCIEDVDNYPANP